MKYKLYMLKLNIKLKTRAIKYILLANKIQTSYSYDKKYANITVELK